MNLNNRFFIYVFGCFLLTLPMISSAFANEETSLISEDSSSMITDPVYVTAGRKVQELMDISYSVNVITKEEIERNPANNLQELLKNIPGITISTGSSADANRILIRGESSSGTLVLIDGAKVSSVFHGHGDELRIDPAIIEKIEVIKGPASVLYGAEALGGVINIITKKGGTKPIQGSTRMSYSSESDSTTFSASLYGKVDDFSYRLLGSFENYGEYLDYHTPIEGSKSDAWDINAYAAYDITDNFSASLNYEHYDQWSEGLSLTSYEDVKTNRYATEFKFTDLASFLPMIKVNAFLWDYKQEDFASTYKTDSIITNYGINLQSDWSIGDHTYIITGFEWLREEYDYDRNYSNGNVNLRDADADTYAAFVSVDHILPYDFTLNYGARYIHYTTEVDRRVELDSTGAYRPGTTPQHNVSGDSEGKVIFNAGLIWSGIDNLALRMAWAQGYRPPTFYYKYLDIPSGHGGFIGNPDLVPETSDNFEIGARYDNGKFSADISTYYNISKERISTQTVNINGRNYTQWINVDKTNTIGIEFIFNYKFANGIEPYLNGSWLRRKYEYDDGTSVTNSGIPDFSARFGIKYNYTFKNDVRFNADLYGIYNSEVKFRPYVSSLGGYIDAKNDDFITGNLSFGFEWGKNADYYLQVDLKNIFDQKYEYLSNYDEYEPGFNAGLVLGMRF